MPFEYNAKVVKVIDGDTIEVDIDLGFDVILTSQRVRLLGIDTPESRTADKVEKVFGLASKEFLKDWLKASDNRIIIRTFLENSDEKFGRILGELIAPKTSEVYNRLVCEQYHAVPYHGQNKELVQAAHLENRKKLIELKKVILS